MRSEPNLDIDMFILHASNANCETQPLSNRMYDACG
eukprot:SAG22_NODE_10686_length_521_cov_0.528436_1_plen_35_part_10